MIEIESPLKCLFWGAIILVFTIHDYKMIRNPEKTISAFVENGWYIFGVLTIWFIVFAGIFHWFLDPALFWIGVGCAILHL